MEALLDALLERCAPWRGDPFSRLQLIVPQPVLATWLELALSTRLGVCMGVDFLLPAAALAKLTTGAAHTDEDKLDWLIFATLMQAAPTAFAPVLAAPGAELKALRLAHELARVFDEYLLYRGAECEETLRFASSDDPQAQLWRALSTHIRPHRGERLAHWCRALESGQHDLTGLQWHWFVSTALPQPQLRALSALQRAGASISLYVLSPSRDYFRDLLRTRQAPAVDSAPQLLSLSGRRFADLTEQLLSLDADGSEDAFVAPEGDSVLARLQRRLLDLGEESVPTAIAANDHSVRIALAANETDELIALKAELKRRLNADPTLEPRDILVLTPSIDRYANLVEAIFGPIRRNDDSALPFSLTDRRQDRELKLGRHLLLLLRLDPGALDIEQIGTLLRLPAYQERLALDPASAEQLLALLAESGFRFGVDQATRERSGLGAFSEHSLRFVLDRLLLGLALPSTMRWQNCVALPSGALSAANRIAALVMLLDDLTDVDTLRASSATAAHWESQTLALIARCYPASSADRDALERTVHNEAARAQQVLGSTRFGIEVWCAALAARLAPSQNASGFLSGGITFSALVPMRAVPARVVCLIGCNDGEFPRASVADGLNLMRRAPRPGERDLRSDDRHLFLEAVLSARDALYFSAIAFAPHDLRPRALSPLLRELKHDLALVARDPDSLVMTIAMGSDETDSTIVSSPSPMQHAAIHPPARAPMVTLVALERALKNLPRRYLQPRFALPEASFEDADALRIEWDFDDAWRLKSALWAEPGLSFADAVARGLLALPTDDSVYAQTLVEVNLLRAAVPPKTAAVPAQLSCQNWRVLATLEPDAADANCQTLAWLSRSSASQLLSAWVRHLAFALTLDEPAHARTRVLSLDRDKVNTRIIRGVAQPAEALAELLALYQGSESTLTGFYPGACLTFLQGHSIDAAQTAMHGDDFKRGLLRDPYFALAWELREAEFADDVAHYANRVFAPILQAIHDDV